MTTLRKVGSVYARIGRTYRSWAPALVPMALVVFLPLGLLDAISASYDVEAIDLSDGVKVAALVAAIAALTTTSLLGDVFYSGAVAISLTHPRHQRPPGLREVARRINYKRLILVDIAYVVIVVIGLALAIVPGALAFVFFGLAGPIIEIEGRTVRGALARSFQLVRSAFWVVALVLVPIELAGDTLGEGLEHLVHDLLGDGFFSAWIADAASNVVLSPIFGIAAVLLTLDLIAAHDGDGPRLNPEPTPTAPPR